MYKGKNGSPQTVLVNAISASDISMTVDDSNVLPPAPNICVIGNNENAEIVSYTAINEGVVSGLVRGLNGTVASPWPADTLVARNFTTLDHDTLINNITALNNEKQAKLTFDNVPASGSSNPVKSGGIYTALQGKANTSSLGDMASKDNVDLASDVIGVLPAANGGTGNAAGLAASAVKLETARTIRTNLGSGTAASFDGTANATPGVTGTLPIGNGGTGLTASPSMLTNLASGSAANILAASPRPGVTGVLPAANGGTGNTNGLAASAEKLETARTIRTNLGSSSAASFDGTGDITPGITGTLPVGNGGTGATERKAAFKAFTNENIGSAASHFITITSEFANVGYSSAADAWTVLGGGAIGKKASLEASDIPNLDTSKITSGALAIARGGTGAGDSGWLEYANSSVFTGNFYYRKVGIFLFITAINIKLATKLTANSYVQLGTLPSGYHPMRDITPACFANTSVITPKTIGCRIVGDGRIFIYANNAAIDTSYSIYFSGFCMSAI